MREFLYCQPGKVAEKCIEDTFYINLLFRFRWDIASFQPDFSIHPVEGYITPGMEVNFEVSFHPQEINQDIRYDVRIQENLLYSATVKIQNLETKKKLL